MRDNILSIEENHLSRHPASLRPPSTRADLFARALRSNKCMVDLPFKMSARENAVGVGSESTTKAHQLCSSATRKIFMRMHFSSAAPAQINLL